VRSPRTEIPKSQDPNPKSRIDSVICSCELVGCRSREKEPKRSSCR
jgi:hypothetical protein